MINHKYNIELTKNEKIGKFQARSQSRAYSFVSTIYTPQQCRRLPELRRI